MSGNYQGIKQVIHYSSITIESNRDLTEVERQKFIDTIVESGDDEYIPEEGIILTLGEIYSSEAKGYLD